MWKLVGQSKGYYPLVVLLLILASSVIGEDKSDPRLKAPWVASIFKRNPSNDIWEFICSGTVTGSFTVITSARCVRPRVIGDKFSTRPYHLNYENLQVVVGLKTNDYDSKDEYTQYGIVGQIRDIYQDSDTPYKDLAALRLKNRFNLSTPYVKEAFLTEQVGTLLELNATKPGDVVIVAGFERESSVSGVKTRSQKRKSQLKVYESTLTDISTCINRYIESYSDAYYFDILCGSSQINSTDIIPCHLEGAGMITRVKSGQTSQEAYYLMGVYSSNTALAKTEGNLKIKNVASPPECISKDLIFFTKLGYLGRWGISHSFCDNDLAMCSNNKCRPWKDLCDGQTQCEDYSDEKAEICFNQQPCANNQFRCEYGACIDNTKICNGAKDCVDNSDEDLTTSCKNITLKGTRPSNCPGIPEQKGVEVSCTHPDRKDIFSCKGSNVPIGTFVILKRNEVRATCTLAGVWSENVILSC